MVDIVAEDGTLRTAVRNIDQVLGLEKEAERERTVADRVADAVAGFVGTLGFVLAHVALVLGWVAINAGLVLGVPAFDPFPFSLLGTLFSLEGVLLASFVLIKQNRMSTRADERDHLDLQISLLAEQEVSKIIQMLQRISRAQGIEAEVVDEDAREIGETTAVGGIAHQLHDKLPSQAGRATPRVRT